MNRYLVSLAIALATVVGAHDVYSDDKPQAAPVVSTEATVHPEPYRIIISAITNSGAYPPLRGRPFVDVCIANTSSFNTSLELSNPLDDFIVSVNYRSAGMPVDEWKLVSPKVAHKKWSPIIYGSVTKYMNGTVSLKPGEKIHDIFRLDNFDMSALGDYQVALSMHLGDCSLQPCRVGVVGGSNCNDILVNSNTVTVRHTPDGVAPVKDLPKKL